ncbi:hypothetical protein FO519_009823, partial [Halicephalobus sp. NKZ332]
MRNFIILILLFYFVGIEACEHNDKKYVDGQQWISEESFVMKCIISEDGSWRTKITACLASTGDKIPIGSSFDNGVDEWKCSADAEGKTSLNRNTSPKAKCEGHEVGSTWQKGSFEHKCLPRGVIKFTSCVLDSGQKIPVNRKMNVDGLIMVCKLFSNGTIRLYSEKSTEASTTHCTDKKNKEHQAGEYWIDSNRFNTTCNADGAIEVVNCVSKSGVQIPVDRQIIKKGLKY